MNKGKTVTVLIHHIRLLYKNLSDNCSRDILKNNNADLTEISHLSPAVEKMRGGRRRWVSKESEDFLFLKIKLGEHVSFRKHMNLVQALSMLATMITGFLCIIKYRTCIGLPSSVYIIQ
jgi:hypothetical protein